MEDVEDQALLVGVTARRAHPGLEVRTAVDGAEGIAYLEGRAPFDDRTEHPLPDLVILDLYMPKTDGFGVLEWLRDNPDVSTAPVVVLTASMTEEDERRALSLGATSVHRKPPDLSELAEVVRDIVHTWIGRGQIIAAHIWDAG